MKQVQRSLIAMFLVLAVAAAAVAVAYQLTQREAAQTASNDQRKKPLHLQADDVVRLSVTRGERRVVIERSTGRWRITQPVHDLADDSAVNGVLNAAADLTLAKTFDSSAMPDASALQLVPPRVELLLASASGSVGIHLGRRNAFDGRVYLRAGLDPATAPIAMVDAAAANALDRDLASLRDRRLLPVTTHRATSLAVSFARSGEQAISYAAVRDVGPGNSPQWDDPWRLTAPLAAAADADTINQLLQQLGSATYDDIVSEEPSAPLSHYGLEPPAIAVVIKTTDGEQTLDIGDAIADSGRHLAQRAGQSAIVAVPAQILTALRKTPFELEEKRALTFRGELVRQLKLQLSDDGLAVLERERGDNDVDRWTLLAPRPAAVKNWRASSLLFALTNLKAKRYAASGLDPKVEPARLAPFGLDRPRQTIVAFDADQRELGALLIGNTSGEEAFVMLRGGERVLVVDRASIEELPQKLDDLIEEPATSDSGKSRLRDAR